MPSDSVLEHWVEEDGLTHEEIQQRIKEIYNEDVALSTVSGHLSRIGLTNRVRYDEIPWERIALDHNHAYPLSMLRIAARINRGLDVRPVDQRRFDRWKTELLRKNLRVHYEYDSPEGFYYVAARPEDTGLVRNP
jgi:DNA-binding transcriptional ArsR family regulator